MSQTTFDEEDLFGEAAAEMRSDVESQLAEARAALPAADAVWDVEADNALGVLNSLRSALDVDEASESLRQAKKQFVMGERADAFEDAADLKETVDEVEALIEEIEAAHEDVGDLAGTLPGLRSALQESGGGAGDTGADEASEDEA